MTPENVELLIKTLGTVILGALVAWVLVRLTP